ncbi:type II secretion system protein [Sulfurovum sp. TSL1]|uniref:type II secretion system protein n=1 Tax=Sulfurovum sp. TSL1 TaxID=2826994 RepID=UPI001CC8185E|nr:type II secretion system protein [Sulfurovum sp. TSL1]
MRPAIAMLELIFAIVIMGIILMSAPQLISTAAKSGYVAIQQEAINEAAAQVNMIMGYHWDENDVSDEYIDPILIVSNGDSALDEDGTTGRRLGTPKESYRSFIRADGRDDLNASSLGSDGTETEEDDIDDFTGVRNLREVETSIADTVETNTIDIDREVVYSSDSANYNQTTITFAPSFTDDGATTNIKSIIVKVTSSSGTDELDKEIILRGFSCNIGGYRLEDKEF